MNSMVFIRAFASRSSSSSIRVASFVPATSNILAWDRCRLATPLGVSAPQCRWNSLDTKNAELVYENRYAFLVNRLKSVSLITCGLGLFGMPALISVYSGDLPVIKQYALAFAAVMSGGTTTVALAFVFDPYVHYIEKIPIRQCHAKIDLKNSLATAGNASEGATTEASTPIASDNNSTITNESNEPSTLSNETTTTAPILEAERVTGELKSISAAKTISMETEQPYLLRAITKNILLMTVETVFDPNKDIQPYNGYRPIANFAAKDKALYVHPELLFDETLRKQLHFLLETRQRPAAEDEDD